MRTDKNTENQNTKRRSTFAILFYINRTKVRKDGMCQLLCKVSIDAEWEQIGTKVSVNPSIWNPDKGRADGRSENAVTVNRAIDELTKEITEHYNHIKKSLGFVTAELVKNAVKGIGQKPVTLLALFREHNEEFKKRVGVDRIQETYDCYQRSYKHLAAFIQEKRGVEDVTLRSLDKVFYDDFEIFLQTDCKMKPKTVHEHMYVSPVPKRLVQGETAEIRCEIVREGYFSDTRYTIRYFQPDGKGTLRIDDGMVLLPNDRYPLDRDVFRLYYTSECEDQQTIDVYFEDNHDQLYQLTFTFNNEAKEEEDTTEGNTITPIGTIVSPININP